VAAKYAAEIPLILKINSHEVLYDEKDPMPALTASPRDALRLGCAAIGYTIYVVGGAVLAGTIRMQAVKEVALVIAGVGVYDLIASNLKMLGLPVLPYIKAMPAAGHEPGVIGSSYQQVAADYAPALGSSYQQVGEDDISYGGDAVEIE
jgi:hypothetical protein